MINLISDTVTKPSAAMLKAMMAAEVGDDVFREDPTVNRLEAVAAEMFAHEAALFCPSGTMTNQIALKIHTRPLDEVVCDRLSHIYQSEGAAYAMLSGIGMNLLDGENGILSVEKIAAAIRPEADWLPKTRLVSLENTCNIGGGSFYRLDQVRPIRQLCSEKNLGLHLDGARLFNALAETHESPADWGKNVDSISLCLSKGLGAPVGSLLIGGKDFIKDARRLRKVIGGAMRQSGYLAAAGIFALENNIARLKIDHDHARLLAGALLTNPFVEKIRPVQTNIVFFDLKPAMTGAAFLEKLKAKGILGTTFGPQTVRFVTHLDVSEREIREVCRVLGEMG